MLCPQNGSPQVLQTGWAQRRASSPVHLPAGHSVESEGQERGRLGSGGGRELPGRVSPRGALLWTPRPGQEPAGLFHAPWGFVVASLGPAEGNQHPPPRKRPKEERASGPEIGVSRRTDHLASAGCCATMISAG